jgi:cell division protein FtsQ
VSQVSSPVDRRFRRAQFKPARRRWTKRIGVFSLKYLVVPAVCVLVATRVWSSVVGASALRVRHIAISGNARLQTGQIIALLEGLSGEPLLAVELSRWRDRLLASPWVADAHLRRRLPSTVIVQIAERDPIALARFGSELYLMDEQGVVLDEYGPQYGDLDLPVVDGLGAVQNGLAADRGRVDLAARLISSLRASPALAKRLSQVNVSDEHDAAVILTGDQALLHVGTDQFVSRLVAYTDLSGALQERIPEIDSVDLRFEDRMFVRPAGRTSVDRSGGPEPTRNAAPSASSRRLSQRRTSRPDKANTDVPTRKNERDAGIGTQEPITNGKS